MSEVTSLGMELYAAQLYACCMWEMGKFARFPELLIDSSNPRHGETSYDLECLPMYCVHAWNALGAEPEYEHTHQGCTVY